MWHAECKRGFASHAATYAAMLWCGARLPSNHLYFALIRPIWPRLLLLLSVTGRKGKLEPLAAARGAE